MRATFGMAVHRDFHGVYFTVQALRLYHAEALRGAELLVVDNAPDTEEGKLTREFLGWVKGDVACRYVAAPEVVGTAAPRDRVFREAQGDVVVCMDCHVLFTPGSLARLLDYFDGRPSCRDLVQGAMVYDDGRNRATHFADEWRSQMWGTWASDPRGDPFQPGFTGEPFDVPGQGLGMFAMRKGAWPGFAPGCKGFGGEEMVLHAKVRQLGGRTVCHPRVEWLHRFGRPGGPQYPLQLWDKVRNYVLGCRWAGIPLDRAEAHFVAPQGPLPREQWEAILAGADRPAQAAPQGGAKANGRAARAGGCNAGCGQGDVTIPHEGRLAAPPASIEDWFAFACKTPSHLDRHLPRLRDLAAEAGSVLELGGERAQSTVALRAGCEKVTVVDPKVWREDAWLMGHGVSFVRQRSESYQPGSLKQDGPSPRWGLCFIDTAHTAPQVHGELTRYAPHVDRFCIHDTQLYGEVGQDGKAGLLPGIRTFLRDNKEWTVIEATPEQYGLMVLSRLPADRPALPSLWRQAVNFTASTAKHLANGAQAADEATLAARLDACMMCEHRAFDRCGKCGCPVQAKAARASEACPDDPPRWGRVELPAPTPGRQTTPGG